MHRSVLFFLLAAMPCFGLPCEDDSCMRSDDGAQSSLLLQYALNSARLTLEPGSRAVGPGAPWTEAEGLIVMAKLHEIVHDWRQFLDMASKSECYAEGPTSNSTNPNTVPCSFWHGGSGPATRGIWPTWPKMLRLGFHDCMRYKDGTGGCDGCMNFENMYLRFIKPSRRGVTSRPTHPGGHNANLAFMGDILELIYTDPKFPPDTPIFGQSPDHPDGLSMRDSGKSRADLWAFATLVATQQGLASNNEKCLMGETYYSTLGTSAPSCHISLNRPMQFKTGRADCSPSDQPVPWQCAASCGPSEADKKVDPNCREGFFSCARYASCDLLECRGCDYCQPAVDGNHRPRSFETVKMEEAPNPDFNGDQLADFFKRELNFSKREAVTIMGAHSYGIVHGEVSGGYRYDWVHKQTDVLNNVYYTLLTLQPGKHFESGSRWGVKFAAASVGGVNGTMADTRFLLHQDGKELGGGHFQWFHQYLRCPFCVDGINLDRHQNIWGSPKDRCCELCSKATKAVMLKQGGGGGRVPFEYDLEGLTAEEEQDFVTHKCLQWVSVHETEFTADIALHKKLQTETGGWPLDKAGNRIRHFGTITADDLLNDLKDDDDDLNMHEIVELFAREQDTWANAFVQTVEKMLETGSTSLQPSFDLGTDVSCGMDSKRQWQCRKGAATCFGYQCPYSPHGFVAKPNPSSIVCDSTWQETGEALCSPQECCLVPDNSLPEDFQKLGPGFCKSGYYSGWRAEDAVDVATCAAKCRSEPQCQFFSLRQGRSCSRYTDAAGDCLDRPGGQHDHVSYARVG
eukprot:TRINITY_DN19527_c0_g1_i1.p1 TRINITY_DN19527_c0_g1~~TRINITY_DN19527_c0_g1_i1.p1  ORF type:complete len:797 (+),score=130.25 TRINITY_DN19527_c0_g1_i1:95-2485(+)